MHHIDEHTIELYVLNSDLVKDRREEIESHFEECHGCRLLAEQIEAFYKQAEGFLPQSIDYAEGNLQQSKALVRVHQAVEPHYEPYYPPVPYRPTTFVGKFKYFVREHPVAASTSSVGTMAMIAAALVFGLKDFFKDTNPAYTHLNPENAVVEVYNKGNELLWNFPSKGIYRVPPNEYTELSKRAIVADLNGDNRNEVITTLPMGVRSDQQDALKIISPDGKTSINAPLRESIQFRGANYAESLTADNLVCEDFENTRRKQLIAVANNGRSPNILFRLTGNGEIVGEYFHFGHGKIAVIDDESDGKKKIAFCGQNDVGDPDSLSYAVLIVLDPTKIVGKTEASDSRGFGLPVSPAERYVIRFPLSDVNRALKAHACPSGIQAIQFKGSVAFQVDILGNYGPKESLKPEYPIFWYIFAPDMSVIEVKYENITKQIRQELVDQGKLTGKIDQAYLDSLKNGVRYWNGHEWRKEVARVEHTP